MSLTRSAAKDPKRNPDPRKGVASVVPRRVKAEATEEEEGRRNVFQEVGVWVIQNKVSIMSNVALAATFYLLGALSIYHHIENRYKDSLMQETTNRVLIKLVTTNDSLLRNVTLTYLQREDVGRHIVDTVIPVLREHAKDVTFVTNVTNTTWVEYQCLQDSENQWKRFENQLNQTGQKLQEDYDAKLLKEMGSFTESFKGDLSQARSDMDAEMGRMKQDFAKDSGNLLRQARQEAGQVAERETRDVKAKQEEISNHLKLEEHLMESRGFLKIETVGPVLLAIAAIEVVLMLCVCHLFARIHARQDRQVTHPEGRNTQAAAPSPAPQPPQPSLLNTSNTNLLCLSFRDSDEGFSKVVGRGIVEGCGSQRIHLRSFVVNRMDDIRDIPACRAALVFVDPDEREMIIEDERYHIGQGLRRNAVQRLLDSGVEVFIVIFNDKRSTALPDSQLYNSKLGQVDEHCQLKRLKRLDRVFSIKDQLHGHQRELIVREFNTIFG